MAKYSIEQNLNDILNNLSVVVEKDVMILNNRI